MSLTFESISDQRLSDLLRAADVVLLPYRSVTSSGALLHALSVATGIVTSDLPYFREVLGAEPDAGGLFPPDDPQALARAVVDCLAVPKEGRVRAIERLRGRLSWSACVKPLAAWLAQRNPNLRRIDDQGVARGS